MNKPQERNATDDQQFFEQSMGLIKSSYGGTIEALSKAGLYWLTRALSTKEWAKDLRKALGGVLNVLDALKKAGRLSLEDATMIQTVLITYRNVEKQALTQEEKEGKQDE